MAKSSASIKREINATKNSINEKEQEASSLRRRISYLDIAIAEMETANNGAHVLRDRIKRLDRQSQWVGNTKDKFETEGYSPLREQANRLANNTKQSLSDLKGAKRDLESRANSLEAAARRERNKLGSLNRDYNKAKTREARLASRKR